jgi:hypothetical protein
MPCEECEALDSEIDAEYADIETHAGEVLWDSIELLTKGTAAVAACGGCYVTKTWFACAACAAGVVATLQELYDVLESVGDVIVDIIELYAGLLAAIACWYDCIHVEFGEDTGDTASSDTGDTEGFDPQAKISEYEEMQATLESWQGELESLQGELESVQGELEDAESFADDYDDEEEGEDGEDGEEDYSEVDDGWEE